MNDMVSKPKQRLSYREKVKNKNAWGKENGDYWIKCANFASYDQMRFSGVGSTAGSRDLGLLYRIYNSEFPASWFHYIINPMNSSKQEYQNHPAKIRPYNLFRSSVDLFVGEYLQRPSDWIVYVEGEDGYNAFMDSLNTKLQQNLEQIVINTLNEAGIDTGQPTKSVEDLTNLKESHELTFRDEMSIVAQRELDLAIKDQSINQKKLEMFLDWLIAGEAYSYKGVIRNEVVYERVSPLHFWHLKSEDSPYVEDGEAWVRRMMKTPSDVLDMFYDEITDKQLDSLDVRNGMYSTAYYANTYYNSLLKTSTTQIPVIHFAWKSQREIFVLHYIDDFGVYREEEVGEEYEPDPAKGEYITRFWGNEIWHGYQVNGEDYFQLGPLGVQRNELNNYSKCKGPYNGRKFSDTHANNISLTELCIPYLILFVAVNYKIELEMNKSGGKIVLMDKNVIPREDNWDEEKFFYYARDLGWALMNRNQIGVDKSMNQYTVLDLSLYDHIAKLIEIKDSIKEDWDESLGISRQRKSNITQNDSVGGTQAAIFQSTVISEPIFNKFEELLERDMQGVLDHTKFANLNGKKATYINDDRKLVIHEIIPEKYCSTNFGLYVTKSTKEVKKLNLYRQQAAALSQRADVDPLAVLEVAAGENTAKIKQSLQRIQAESARRQAQQAEQENQMKAQAQQEAIQMEQTFKQIEMVMQEDLLNTEWDRRDQNELIKGEIELAKAGLSDGNANGIPDITEIMGHANDREKIYNEKARDRAQETIKKQELMLKSKELQHKVQDSARSAQIERENMKNDLQIAKENAKGRAKPSK